MNRMFVMALLIFYTHTIVGQAAFESGKSTSEAFLKKVVPPSPTAASLGKYGDQQISMFTGTPSVNIPIYGVKANDISVPISLSYSSTGLKVTEAASWVGLGWTLNGMGVITRVAKGAPDFTGGKDFFNIRTYPLPLTYSNINNAGWSYIHSSIANTIDPEPDLYIVHMGSLNFKFYYDLNKRIQTVPYNNQIRVSFEAASNSFVVTDESGVKYFFGGGDANETTSPEGAASYTSSWFISKVLSPTGTEVNFTYVKGSTLILQDQYSETEEVRLIGSTGYCAATQASGRTAQFSIQNISPSFLTKIETDDETVNFIRDVNERADQPGDYALKEINVYAKSTATVINIFQFNYSYFPQVSTVCWGDPIVTPAHQHNHTAVCKRLRLDEFIEKGRQGNTTGFKTTQFQYSAAPVPSRCSLDQDHWGYYNGAGNTSLLPSQTDASFASSTFNANSREANHSYSQAGLLLKIIYPTGGESNFTYEPNSTTTLVNASSQSTTAGLSGISPLYESSSSFTVNQTQTLFLKYTLEDANLFDQGLQRKVEIIDQAGVVRFSATNSNTGEEGVSTFCGSCAGGAFPPGTYTLKVSRNYVYSSYSSIPAQGISATVMYNNPSSAIVTREIGGLRVKKIVDKTSSTSAEINVKEYIYENQYVVADIKNSDYKANYKRGFLDPQQLIYECQFLNRSSSSVQPLGSIAGGAIGYGKVTTLYGTGGTNGKTEYYYSYYPDAGGYSIFPIARPIISYDHRRGNLLRQSDYDAAGNPLKIVSTNYEYITKYNGSFSRPYYSKDIPIGSFGVDITLLPYKEISFIDFSMPSEWVRPKNTSETIYSGTSHLTTIKEFFYDNPHYNAVTRTKTIDSKGDTFQVNNTFPLDYKPASILCKEEIERKFETDYQILFNSFSSCVNPASTESAKTACYNTYQANLDLLRNDRLAKLNSAQADFLTLANATTDIELKNKYKLIAYNFTSAPIENKLLKLKNGTTELRKSLNEYDEFATGSMLLSKISSSRAGSTLREDMVVEKYNSKGSVVQAKTSDGITNCFIWDYSEAYLVAEIKNAADTNVAYTSFETAEKGNWVFTGSTATDISAITGKKVYDPANGTISKKILTAGDYIVSYWSKNGNKTVSGSQNVVTGRLVGGWTYYEHKVTLAANATVTISGAGVIDELRLYPKAAQMSTYCYEPLIGITAKCDINNLVMYYEYDLFNRLKLIRDQDKNIIKTVEYKYQEQQ